MLIHVFIIEHYFYVEHYSSCTNKTYPLIYLSLSKMIDEEPEIELQCMLPPVLTFWAPFQYKDVILPV